MKIDVRHIAGLARLRLDEEKADTLTRQMYDIIAMVEHLPELEGELEPDRDNVMALRQDRIGASLPRGDLLSNAPEKQAGCFVVPKTVKE